MIYYGKLFTINGCPFLYKHAYSVLGSGMMTLSTWFLSFFPCKSNLMFGKGSSMILHQQSDVQLGTVDRNEQDQECLKEIGLESIPSAELNPNHDEERFEVIESQFSELKIRFERMQELLTK